MTIPKENKLLFYGLILDIIFIIGSLLFAFILGNLILFLVLMLIDLVLAIVGTIMGHKLKQTSSLINRVNSNQG